MQKKQRYFIILGPGEKPESTNDIYTEKEVFDDIMIAKGERIYEIEIKDQYKLITSKTLEKVK